MSDPIAFMMHDASRLFRRAFNARARELGVTGPQWRALVVVSRRPGINQCAAAELLEVEPITLSRMVDRLQEAGMIERRASPADRRAWCLHLTEAAVPMVAQMRVIVDELTQKALAGFDDGERDSFFTLVERFRGNLAQCSAPIRDNDHDRKDEPRHARAG
ncbi:MAG: MarR family winged helix-turn-helix transcriptional regulator [Sphingopyxis sp.]